MDSGDQIQVKAEPLSLEQLQQGDFQISDPEFGKTISSALNPLMRAYFDATKAPEVHFPTDTAGVLVVNHNERHADHFLEVQHVLQAVLTHPNYNAQQICNVSVGALLRPSRFLNHQYNLYSIPAAWNLYKSKIGFELYNPTAYAATDKQKEQQEFIRQYMALEIDADEVCMVEDRILLLLQNMEHAQGAHAELCHAAGEIIGSFLQDISPTFKAKVNIGAYNKN